jgi:hypothetical protein
MAHFTSKVQVYYADDTDRKRLQSLRFSRIYSSYHVTPQKRQSRTGITKYLMFPSHPLSPPTVPIQTRQDTGQAQEESYSNSNWNPPPVEKEPHSPDLHLLNVLCAPAQLPATLCSTRPGAQQQWAQRILFVRPTKDSLPPLPPALGRRQRPQTGTVSAPTPFRSAE